MREDGWDIAGAIEHNLEVKKVRALIEAVRNDMPPDKREFVGLVAKEVHARSAEVVGNRDTIKALLSLAILRLCEDAETT